MLKKLIILISLFVLVSLCVVTIVVFELNKLPVGSALAGLIIGSIIPFIVSSSQNLSDTNSWKTKQRQLQRGSFINKNTMVRISFAYLFRIKSGNKYLLVQNSRNTGKYQPVGGVYKCSEQEMIKLKNLFHIADDDKIHKDKSSKNDYRMYVKNAYLRKFVKRFDTKADRETICDLSREFQEELISTGILDWNVIKYRYCGRHFAGVQFSDYFQTYELVIADIVEILPTDEQTEDLLKLEKNLDNGQYCFAFEREIKSLGVDPDNGKNEDYIASHSFKVLDKEEANLVEQPKNGGVFTALLRN